MDNKERLDCSGYAYIKYLGDKQHLLKDKATGKLEVWVSNKNHASYGIVYKNTHLEFVRSY